MYFSRKEITEKNMIDLIEKEVHIPKQIAEQIAKDIKEKIIPTLWNKMPETEREKLLNNNKKENITEGGIKKPDIKSVEENAKIIGQERETTSITKPFTPNKKELIEELTPKAKKIKNTSESEMPTPILKEKNRLPKKPLTQEKPMTSGPDKYREPI